MSIFSKCIDGMPKGQCCQQNTFQEMVQAYMSSMQFEQDVWEDCTAAVSPHKRHLTVIQVADFKKFCTTVKSQPSRDELRTKSTECATYLEKLYAQSDNGSILKNFGAIYLRSVG